MKRFLGGTGAAVLVLAVLVWASGGQGLQAQTQPLGFGPDPCQGRQVCVADGLQKPLDTTPNDALYAQQYGPQRIAAPAAWDLTTGAAAVVIAIVDTGTDCTHPELAGKCTAGWDFVSGIALTGTENSDGYGHGTHVASIAAANTNNATGIAGVCWLCQVMPVRVLDSFGGGTWVNVAAGIRFAADNGSKIISMSLGGTGFDQGVADAVDYAWGRGVLVVSACGNTGTSPCLFPAAYANSMAVSCSDSADAICGFSSFGDEVDVSAPGLGVIAAVPMGLCTLCDPSGYKTLSGTSMSTPHVSGVAGLAFALHPADTNEQVYGLLEQSSDDKGAVGFDTLYGFGRVNAYGAVTQAAPTGRLTKPSGTPTPTPTSTLSPTPTPCPGKLNPNGKCIGKGH